MIDKIVWDFRQPPKAVQPVYVRIVGERTLATLTTRSGIVTHAPSVVGFMHGWDGRRVRDYCKQHGLEAVRL